ncbi:MAG: UDP-3-O-(3-hydroxymyristoyl)glucosamine N-acyltransferase, partial [Alphaproteobacteria bacterium]
GPGDLTFFENRKYLEDFRNTCASACFVAQKFAAQAPEGVAVLLSEQPYRSFAQALAMFYPDALNLAHGAYGNTSDEGTIHPSAEIEEGAVIEPGAVIGPEARIGQGTRIGAGAVIGYRVHVGRDCYIGPNATLIYSLLGNRVYIHPGASIGQDGFGFAMGPAGHLKVPQIGRVIIQDDVEIGANTTIDRGALRDTIIGEGTKIDNLVQIAHNVVIGRHCVIVAQVGISGSTTLEDFVALGGQVGVIGHVTIGAGAQIAASSNVNRDVPPGVTWGGTPAKPMRLWFRELTILKKLAEKAEAKGKKPD